MIQIDDKLISDELFEARFVCDLSACKGACCVEGDSGAPIEKGEADIVERDLDAIWPYMSEAGKKAVKKKGVSVVDEDGERVTPLVNGKECAFVNFDDKGVARCSIEMANRAGKTDFKKPISCHLYPIRLTELKDFVALNYHKWPICAPACECGGKLNVKVFRFLRESIERKFGKEFYQKMEKMDEMLSAENG